MENVQIEGFVPTRSSRESFRDQNCNAGANVGLKSVFNIDSFSKELASAILRSDKCSSCSQNCLLRYGSATRLSQNKSARRKSTKLNNILGKISQDSEVRGRKLEIIQSYIRTYRQLYLILVSKIWVFFNVWFLILNSTAWPITTQKNRHLIK